MENKMQKLVIIVLTAIFMISCASPPQPGVQPVEVIDPEFNVISIYILQADIVVTEFEATLKVNNPNDFPMVLSSIAYELYGNGRFWAGNTVSDILQIPANSSRETKFTFTMNFIDMNRQLLDDVIAMRQVNYRFRGKARVQPVIRNSSVFDVDFDCSGLSEVRRRAN
jgi:LEA14-like dessication related protein